ncbi:Acetylornithine aminotransferase [Salinivirga cyanobacteriivorans]|uniref:Acetylornithine aminotransferase n=1 Tax=Salinivirga cyanobacteriivorans TaxID=1307839 RepID=A0A0S2I284_9BACT|nr:aspartate aminotransferase family protein [Salinivirga cyanobacteriivorans]ALO16372.1 Acetylornithine aminotransferase [Salinivirga cyanobacteriivorans]
MTTKTNQFYHELDQQHYLQTFKRYPVTLERGQGARVWDVEDNEYIDALGGIAVNSLGHNHPALVKAIQEQASKLIHISNFYLSEPQVKLSEKLTTLSGLDRVFFSNSGAESVEGAIKIARKYAHSKGKGGEIISFEGSFHGRTLATIATGKAQMQKGFEPIPAGFHQIPAGDMKKLRETASNLTAAIIIEPIQGEGGINVADVDFMHDLREFCNEHDIVLIFDEIQCGIARTGKMLAWEHYGVKPDIITLAKGLGGGVPIGAILSNQRVSDAIDFGDHGTTFGGNPLSTAAALATLETIEQDNLVQEAHEKGAWLVERIQALNEISIKEIRGKGLMIGIEFNFETKPLVAKMLEHGVLANATAGNVLRLVPPLVITYDEMKKVVEVIKQSLKEINHD